MCVCVCVCVCVCMCVCVYHHRTFTSVGLVVPPETRSGVPVGAVTEVANLLVFVNTCAVLRTCGSVQTFIYNYRKVGNE